jgi:hypothetical protein
MAKRVLLVGHCGVDGPRLKTEIESSLSGVMAEPINSDDDLRRACEEGGDLFLVNREPVGFNAMGVDIVRDLCEHLPGAKVMLVSDYPDAQEEATRAGAPSPARPPAWRRPSP